MSPQNDDPAAPPAAQASPRPVSRFTLALGALLALVVVGALVLLLIGRSSLGFEGVAVTLGLGLALLQVATLVVVLALVRDARRERVAAAEHRTILARRTQRLVTRSARVGQRSQDILTSVRRLRADHATEVRRATAFDRRIKEYHLQTQRQVQALLGIEQLVEVTAAVPPMGGWAASPDLVLLCMQAVRDQQPPTVVECGSGISTLFMALTVKQHGLATRVIALEHDEDYAAGTRAMLERHGVQDHAEVRVAPLQPSGLIGHDTAWYATEALEGIADVGLLLVDGPPTTTGPGARYPALPLMLDRLASTCLVVMDDLDRVADRDVAERWAEEFSDFRLDVDKTLQKHAGLLRRG